MKKDSEWGIIVGGIGLFGLFISLIIGADTGNYTLLVISFAVMFFGGFGPDYFKNLNKKHQNNSNNKINDNLIIKKDNDFWGVVDYDNLNKLTETHYDPRKIPPEQIYRTPKKIDWEKINKDKKITGMLGEEIVMEIEKHYLKAMNKEFLAEKVEHVSKEKGDGSGYDILSYFIDGRKKYIEVKSTIKSESNSFYLSKNELDFMKENKDNYYIYRVFNVNENGQEPFLKAYDVNDVLNSAEITPTQYIVKI